MTISFEEIAARVAEHYGQTEQPIRLTPRGNVDRLTRQLVAALRTLPPEDRAEALADFAGELRDVIAELAAPTRA